MQTEISSSLCVNSRTWNTGGGSTFSKYYQLGVGQYHGRWGGCQGELEVRSLLQGICLSAVQMIFFDSDGQLSLLQNCPTFPLRTHMTRFSEGFPWLCCCNVTSLRSQTFSVLRHAHGSQSVTALEWSLARFNSACISLCG